MYHRRRDRLAHSPQSPPASGKKKYVGCESLLGKSSTAVFLDAVGA
jgi:hypothetical protein